MNRANLKEKISEISNSEFPLIDFFNDIGWLEGSKWFNTEKAYEDIEKIYNLFVYYTNKNKQLEKENQELKEEKDYALQKSNENWVRYQKQCEEIADCLLSMEEKNNQLLKYQKAIKILKAKLVPILLLQEVDTLEEYNEGLDDCDEYRLTQEEFDLLKKVFESVGGE